jgi:hypothetical protein
MPVIGHEAPGENLERSSLVGLAKDFVERGVIAFLVKEGGAEVAAVEDVINDLAGGGAGATGHFKSITDRNMASN